MKKMPFHEPGYQEILDNQSFECSSNFDNLGDVQNIITVGTPLLAHIETDLSQLKSVMNKIIEHLQPGQNIILRSTVAPRTSEFVHLFIETHTNFKIGKDIFLTFVRSELLRERHLKNWSPFRKLLALRILKVLEELKICLLIYHQKFSILII